MTQVTRAAPEPRPGRGRTVGNSLTRGPGTCREAAPARRKDIPVPALRPPGFRQALPVLQGNIRLIRELAGDGARRVHSRDFRYPDTVDLQAPSRPQASNRASRGVRT